MATCTMCGRDFSSCHHGRAAQSKKGVRMSNTALDQSIRHWKHIARGEGASRGDDNCQLCFAHFDNGCKGCPVHTRTGRFCCHGTPFQSFIDASSLVTTVIREDARYDGYTARTSETKALAWDMVRFLQSLKDEETPPWAKPR